jgi:hypothetical protein
MPEGARRELAGAPDQRLAALGREDREGARGGALALLVGSLRARGMPARNPSRSATKVASSSTRIDGRSASQAASDSRSSALAAAEARRKPRIAAGFAPAQRSPNTQPTSGISSPMPSVARISFMPSTSRMPAAARRAP